METVPRGNTLSLDFYLLFIQAAMVDMIIDTLPLVAAEVAAPLATTNKVRTRVIMKEKILFYRNRPRQTFLYFR